MQNYRQRKTYVKHIRTLTVLNELVSHRPKQLTRCAGGNFYTLGKEETGIGRKRSGATDVAGGFPPAGQITF